MENDEQYEWLVKPKKKELETGFNICSSGYYDRELNVPQSRMMSRNVDAMMDEQKRIETAKIEGKRPPVDKAPDVTAEGKRPMTTGQLYDDLKNSQMRMAKVNKRDHLNEMWGVMKFGNKPQVSSYNEHHAFGEDMKKELKDKDWSNHFKWDKFKQYNEAMIIHKDSIRK